MHDHVIDVIWDIPNIKMEFELDKETWIFTDDNNNFYFSIPNYIDKWTKVMPEWNGFDEMWYWVMVPNKGE